MSLRKFYPLFLISLAIALFIFASYFLLQTGILRFNYPDHSKFPIRGIDVSHHQKHINWLQVSKQSLKFAYIKATEGGDFKDPLFSSNWQQAKKFGLATGAYHFFTFCKSGKVQAENFIETVPYEANALPPVIDIEFGGNCSKRPSANELETQLVIYISLLQSRYKKVPVIYVTKEAYQEFILGKYKNIPIWIRDIYFQPVLPKNRKWTFWQYANRGRIKGISTPVDLNVFHGTATQFSKLIE